MKDELYEKITRLEQKMEDLEKSINQISETLKGLNDLTHAHNSKLNILETLFSDFKNTFAKIPETVLNHEKRLEFLENILKEVKNVLNCLKEKTLNSETKISKFEIELKWFAKIPIIFLLGLNVMIGILNLIRILKGS